jgi:hypothetical protein
MKTLWTARSSVLLGLLLATSSSGDDGLTRAGSVESAATSAASEPAATAAASAFFSRGEHAIVTGWEATPERLESATCGHCHAGAHGEWRDSGHAVAWSDDHFQRAYALEPRRWCRNCHAPLLAQEAGAVRREEGVGCAACHVREGVIRGTQTLDAAPGRHAVLEAAGFSGAEFCGGCHQFPFPKRLLEGTGPAVEYSPNPMQDTLGEWRAAKAKACAECHGGGHRYVGARNREWLSEVFGEPTLSRDEPDVISVSVPLAPRGHTMPTGDLYRSFVFEAAENPKFEPVLARRRYGREFDGYLEQSMFVAGGQSRDTRVPASATRLNLTVDAPTAGGLYLRIRYYRNDPWVHRGWTPDHDSAIVVWSRRVERIP